MLRAVIDGQTVGIRIPLQPQRTPTQMVPAVDRRPVADADEPPPVAPATSTGTTPTPPVAPVPVTPLPPVPPGPTAPAAPPARGPRRRRRRGMRGALIGLAVVLVAAGTALAVTEYRPQHGTPVADPTPTAVAASATGSSPVTPSASTSGASGGDAWPTQAPPAGYRLETDELGFRIPLPADAGKWQRSTKSDEIDNAYYSADGQRHLIQVAKNVGQAQTPLEHLTDLSDQLGASPGLKDYKVLALGSALMDGREAARWVFTFTNLRDPNKGPRKAFEEEVKDSDGTTYSMLVSGPSTSSDETTLTERRFDTLLNYFAVVPPQ
jgi:hypothetical protein